MTDLTLQHVPHGRVEAFERAGWRVVESAAQHHGVYAALMEAPNRVIALTGKKGTGKSAVAAHLVKRYGFQVHKFATPLKNMMRTFGLSEAQIEGDLKEAPAPELGGRTPRWAMQTLGTDWGRDLLGDDIWVDAWQRSLPGGAVVTDDCRFPNEHAAIRANESVIINIHRPGLVSTDTHESETHDLEFDVRIVNDGTVEQLQVAVDRVVQGDVAVRDIKASTSRFYISH